MILHNFIIEGGFIEIELKGAELEGANRNT